jgi:hypothetical protein
MLALVTSARMQPPISASAAVDGVACAYGVAGSACMASSNTMVQMVAGCIPFALSIRLPGNAARDGGFASAMSQ